MMYIYIMAIHPLVKDIINRIIVDLVIISQLLLAIALVHTHYKNE